MTSDTPAVLTPDPQIIVFWAPPSAAGHETGAAQLSCGVGGCLIGWKWQLVSRLPLHLHLLRQQIGARLLVWGGGGCREVCPLSGTCPGEHPLQL